MAITLSEKVKSSGAELPSPPLALPRQPDTQESIVSFRQLGGEFGQTVQSQAGMITVVQENGKEGFRDAVLSGRMDIRSGNQELHLSEIYFVQNNESLLRASTVTEALRSAGAPGVEIGPLLGEIGLRAASQMAPKDLGVSALKRLSIACSLYARARIILYDRPFLGSDPVWVEKIAQLLLNRGEANARAIIVTGETKLPEVWTNNRQVSIQDPRQPQLSSGLIARIPNGQLPTKPGILGGVSPNGELITRPQPIYQQNAVRPNEALKSEAIENPNTEFHSNLQRLGGGAGLSQAQREAEEAARKEGIVSAEEEHRREEGELTRVTAQDRFRAHPNYRKVADAVRKVRGRISARPVEIAIPPAKRLVALKQEREFRLVMLILVFAVLAMCLVSYLSK